MIGRSPKAAKRSRRKPRDIAQSIIHDRLEHIERSAERGPLTVEESDFVLHAYKAFGEADHIDAEVEYLTSLSPKESEKLEDLLAELEEETGPQNN